MESHVISATNAYKLLKKRCMGYWCYGMEVKEKEVKLEDIPIVCEFPDMFPE